MPFERNSDGFDFDTEIIVQLREAGKRIAEVPIPTYYGDEICSRQRAGVRARTSLVDVIPLPAAQARIRHRASSAFASTRPYELEDEAGSSSHGVLLEWLSEPSRRRRCSTSGAPTGRSPRSSASRGHRVTGVDIVEARRRDRPRRRVRRGRPEPGPARRRSAAATTSSWLADVLEHVDRPGRPARRRRSDGSHPTGCCSSASPTSRTGTRGSVWRSAASTTTERGILDRGHLRFFTRHSVERMLRRHGLVIRERRAVGLPFGVVARGAGPAGSVAAVGLAPKVGAAVAALERRAAARWPRCSATSSSISARGRGRPPSIGEHRQPDPAGDHWRRRRAPAGRGRHRRRDAPARHPDRPARVHGGARHRTRRAGAARRAAGGDRRPSSIRPRVRRRRHARHARLRRRPRRRAVRSVPHGGRQPGFLELLRRAGPRAARRQPRRPGRIAVHRGISARRPRSTCTSLRGPRSCGCGSSSGRTAWTVASSALSILLANVAASCSPASSPGASARS